MKKLLVLLFSLFLLSSSSVFADDISDFEIEGISIGDSLLDYMTEDEILKEIELNKDNYYFLKEPHKFTEIYIRKDYPIYDVVSVFIKNNSSNQFISVRDEKFIILSVRGMTKYNEDFDTCILRRDEIHDILSKMFPNQKKIKEVFDHPEETSGNSIIDSVSFNFVSGDQATIKCNDWEENFRIDNNYFEGLSVEMLSDEILSWISDQ